MLLPFRSEVTRVVPRAGCAVMAAAALLLTAGCGPKTPPEAPTPTAATPAVATPAARPVAPAAASPTAAPATPAAPEPLLGHVTRQALRAYAGWLPLWEQPYTPDPEAVATIKAGAKDVTVLLVMGTWCPDSKREMPRYFGTMDAAGIGNSVLTMVGVDRTKKDTEGLTEKYGITRVPTFVFFRNGKEIGRFVERTPAGSTFEAEVAKILGGGLDRRRGW